MADATESPPNVVNGFKGLNNRIDPTRLGLEWQLTAENVLVDDAGYITRRPGIQSFLSGFKDVYGSRNGRFFAITAGDALVELTEAGDDLVLPDTTKPTRYLLIEAVYDSVLYGNDLNLREEGKFVVSNLVAKV